MIRQAKFDQGYEVAQEGDKRIVSFNGAGISWAGYVIFPLVWLGFSVFFFHPSWMMKLLPVVVILASLAVIYPMFQRQSFTLAPGAIIKGSAEYDLARISEVVIDNPMDKAVSVAGAPGLIVGGTGILGASTAAVGVMAGATTNAMVEANLAISRSQAKRRYRVRIRYGSRLVTLARNLTEDQAISVFNLLTSR